MNEQATPERPHDGGWLRVAGLFVVVIMTSVFVNPGVVIGVPLLVLLAARGVRNLMAAAVAGLIILTLAGGPIEVWDGLWYAERAWAVLLAGWFLAITLWRPEWRLTSRALAAAAGTGAVAAGVLAVKSGAWATLDAAVARSVQTELEVTLRAFRALGGPGVVSAEMVSMAEGMAAARVSVFPALLAVESLAALGVAWWGAARLSGDAGQVLSPLRDFRFNDHLVWLLVAGMALVLLQSGAAQLRLGSNVMVLMVALYALRGAAVWLFVTGGVTVLSAVVFVVLLILLPPVILGTAALVGIGDTWLDLRARSADEAA